jgi:hypothetical protein
MHDVNRLELKIASSDLLGGMGASEIMCPCFDNPGMH